MASRLFKSWQYSSKDSKTLFVPLFIFGLILFLGNSVLIAQGKVRDTRVMLQGFYWESYRFGNVTQFPNIYNGRPNESRRWYHIIKDSASAIKKGRFDLIWLPPPGKTNLGAGYDPQEYFNLQNAYGDTLLHRAMLQALWQNGCEPLADIVINHRNGILHWADFKNPDWNTKTICKYDEAFTNSQSDAYNLPDSLRGNEEEFVKEYDPSRERAYPYESFRDIDHTNPIARRDIVQYLLYLKSYGYKGWRYDMVHGYHAKHIAYYNRKSKPSFSVGEYDWGQQGGQRGWVWNTSTDSLATGANRLKTASSVFDFNTYFSLKDAIGLGSGGNAAYPKLYGFNNGLGLVGDNTDGLAWKSRAVTFLENHDTGWRTENSGQAQEHHEHDSFANNWQTEQGYAYILTHPGVPCVYWKHYFEWGKDLQNKIRALINARKVAGVHASSNLYTQDNARAKGVYAAMVEGNNGQLFVRVGGDDNSWNPSFSGYANYIEYAQGNGWKVWVTLKNAALNTRVQAFPLNKSLGTLPKIKKR